MPLCITQEVFGCTETTGPQATNQPGFGKFKPGSVGREHVGVQAGTEVVWSFLEVLPS